MAPKPPKAAKHSPGADLAAAFRLLTSPRFGTFWAANFLSSIGTWTQSVAEPWLLLSLGATPFLIGLDNFAINAPVWALTLVGGILADTHDRRRIITFFQSVQMLCPLIIAVLLFVHANINPWWIIGLSVIVGVTDALSMPSFQSIVPSLVAHDDIPQGLALNSTQVNLSRIIGPALAGVLLGGVGAFACFIVSAASYVPFIGAALLTLPKEQPRKPKPKGGKISLGLRPILARPDLRAALTSVLVTSVLCGPLVTFSPVLVKQVFAGEATHFSAAIGAFGIGGLVGGLALLAVPKDVDRLALSRGAALFYGLILLAVALTPVFWQVVLLMGLAGLAMALANISANAVIQSGTEHELLGQAASLYMLALRGGLPLGAVATGYMVEILGVQHAVLLNGGLAIAAQILLWAFL